VLCIAAWVTHNIKCCFLPSPLPSHSFSSPRQISFESTALAQGVLSGWVVNAGPLDITKTTARCLSCAPGALITAGNTLRVALTTRDTYGNVRPASHYNDSDVGWVIALDNRPLPGRVELTADPTTGELQVAVVATAATSDGAPAGPIAYLPVAVWADAGAVRLATGGTVIVYPGPVSPDHMAARVAASLGALGAGTAGQPASVVFGEWDAYDNKRHCAWTRAGTSADSWAVALEVLRDDATWGAAAANVSASCDWKTGDWTVAFTPETSGRQRGEGGVGEGVLGVSRSVGWASIGRLDT